MIQILKPACGKVISRKRIEALRGISIRRVPWENISNYRMHRVRIIMTSRGRSRRLRKGQVIIGVIIKVLMV